MNELKHNSELFTNKMKAEGLPQLVIDTFLSYYSILTSSDSGYICETDINPVEEGTLPEYDSLSSYAKQGENELKNTAIIKLNGGLGTSMGLDGPKCMLPVKNNLSFFDITVRQILERNKQFDIKIPFILMNSFSTNEKTLELLKQYPDIVSDIPATFVQHKYPKILQDTLGPAQWPKDSKHEWNPPGHGDIYPALFTSGTLQKLLDSGIKYAFVSNIDNLGATMDTSLLGYFAVNNFPFMMEVVERTEMDKKGGHLARLKKNNRLILREQAQAPENEIPQFEDIKRYRYFNSNNIWINLEYLQKVFQNPDEPFQLPLIVNKKYLDPQDTSTPKVFQLETAMGAAISLFPNSQAVAINNDRFRPVKKCENLFILWSDYYLFKKNYELVQNPERTLPPITVTLDEKYYGNYDSLTKQFPSGVPSLVDCKSLTITGNVLFERGVKITGDVRIINKSNKQVVISDGTVIEKNIYCQRPLNPPRRDL